MTSSDIERRSRRLSTVPIRLVAVDLDDTLLTPAQGVSPRTAAAIRSVRARGVAVVPATSRGVPSFREIEGTGGLGPLAVCSNGAVTLDLDRDAVVSSRPIPLPIARQIMGEFRAAWPTASLAAELVTRFFGEEWIMTRTGLRSSEPPVADVIAALEEPPLKVLVSLPTTDSELLASLAADLVGDRVSVTRKPGPWIELSRIGMDKVVALREVSDLLNVANREVLCVGDEDNDIGMLQWAATAAVMTDSSRGALEQADIILPPNADDGVAQLLEAAVAVDFRVDRIDFRC